MAASQRRPNPRPQISEVSPQAAIPGGEFQIRGKGLAACGSPARHASATLPAPVVIGSDSLVIVRVPEGASRGELVVGTGRQRQRAVDLRHRHPDRRQPASGGQPRGRQARQHLRHLQRIARAEDAGVGLQDRPSTSVASRFVTDLMNATGLAFDARRRALRLQPPRRHGVSGVASAATCRVYVEGMGVATGIVFDRDENLYVGDRSGTIFKISRAAPDLRVRHAGAVASPPIIWPSGRTDICTSPVPPLRASMRCIAFRTAGDVEVFYRGLGRPQGMAFDVDGNLYVAASLGGRRGVVRITPDEGGAVPLRPASWARVYSREVDDRRHQQRAVIASTRHRGPAARRRPSAMNGRRRDHRGRVRTADARPHRYQFAVSHRPAQRAGRRSARASSWSATIARCWPIRAIALAERRRL